MGKKKQCKANLKNEMPLDASIPFSKMPSQVLLLDRYTFLQNTL